MKKTRNKFKVRAILFDFDDTIARTRQGKNVGKTFVALHILNYLKKRGIKTNKKRILEEISKTSSMLDSKGVYDRNQWWKEVIKKLGNLSVSTKFLKKLTDIYWEKVRKHSSLYKDTEEVLNYLKKRYKLVLITDTDGPSGNKKKRLKSLGTGKWFKNILVAGEETTATKPAKEVFLKAAQKLGVEAEKCAVVGNELYQDIYGAKNAGMYAILIRRRNIKTSNSKAKPDRVINTLKELKRIF